MLTVEGFACAIYEQVLILRLERVTRRIKNHESFSKLFVVIVSKETQPIVIFCKESLVNRADVHPIHSIQNSFMQHQAKLITSS